MRTIQVDSSAINVIRYDNKTKTLVVLFKHSGEYAYHNVDRHKFYKLAHADSVGTYFNENIKNEYEFTRNNSKTG